ncbi:hypothetical protein QR77_28785 [Streptomyces sp. 150FB]|uniref:hypothetical protein n=1 Tax=Streptomyces sp. 150FB TaxID=1576605 RepID=UPI0005890AF6|nr:hypothetical protein [Streptomyces sp. 150FB]KIF76784.1 hypothetical protein QR77_28785 [Streptomyces sp. 150FB]
MTPPTTPTPPTFLTVPWTPVINAGLPPQHPADGTDPIATVGWLPKLGTEYYPYETGSESLKPPAR